MRLCSLLPVPLLLLTAPLAAQDDGPVSKLPNASQALVALLQDDGQNDSNEPAKVEIWAPKRVDEHSLVLVTVRSNSKFVQLRVRRTLFEGLDIVRVASEKKGEASYVWTGPPGEYMVEANVLDPEKGLASSQVKVTIGPAKPDPDPDPDPEPGPEPDDVPEDRFDNLGRRVAAWRMETVSSKEALSKAKDLSELYQEVADGLAGAGGKVRFVNYSDANAYLTQGRANILQPRSIADEWALVGSRLAEDMREREDMSRQDVIDWYAAVAAGLKGGL